MKERTVILIVILAIFALYLIGSYLGINAEVIANRYCVDSDGGMKVYMPGHVISDIGTYHDKCNTGRLSIREYYCGEALGGGNYQVMSRILECGPGYHCEKDVVGQDDACIRD